VLSHTPMLKLAIDPAAAARLEPFLEEHLDEVAEFNTAVVRLTDLGVRPEDMVELLLLAMASYRKLKETRS